MRDVLHDERTIMYRKLHKDRLYGWDYDEYNLDARWLANDTVHV